VYKNFKKTRSFSYPRIFTSGVARIFTNTKKETVQFQNFTGPGANSEIVFIPDEKNYFQIRENAFKSGVNVFTSDVIGIKRILPGRRPDACKKIKYPENLSSVSIVITFRDKTISCLLRTIYSVLETSPENLIHEIILVDDGLLLIYTFQMCKNLNLLYTNVH
jgi:hypothetical protein